MNMLLLHLMMKFVEQNKSKTLTLTKQEQNIRLEKGYIQGVSDNFDATLSTQNGLKQTHPLVTIITQNGRANEIRKRLVIP